MNIACVRRDAMGELCRERKRTVDAYVLLEGASDAAMADGAYAEMEDSLSESSS